MRRWNPILMRALLAAGMMLAACTVQPPTPTVSPTPAPIPTSTPTPTPSPTPAPEGPVVIRWFIGLGTGSNPEQQPVQELFVENYNLAHAHVELVLEGLWAMIPYDTLKTMIRTGDPPDVVGPVGVMGSNDFFGDWLDLDPYLEGYDLSAYDPAVLDTWRVPGRGLTGLPIGIFPSAIYYNRALFDAAGLPYPPHRYGEPYADGEAWTVEKMAEIAMLLTLDAAGRNATEPGFDPEHIVQWGFHEQWTDARGLATLFGAGSFMDENDDAVIPAHWREAFHWWYEGMWERHEMPTGPQQFSDLLANGNPFSSGRVAMAHSHTWYVCCLGEVELGWDVAAVPSYNGRATARIHTDMVGALRYTEHPEEAVESVYAIASSPQLLEVWGAWPARKDLQGDWIEAMSARFTQGVDWQVFVDSQSYAESPNHESWMPNMSAANDVIGAFGEMLQNTPGLDDAALDAAIDQLQVDLEEVFGMVSVSDLIDALSTGDVDERRAAAEALGRIGSDRASVLSALLRALEDEDAGVRAAAAEALGRIGSDSADVILGLIEALEDEDAGVRAAAAEALGCIGPEAAYVVPLMIPALEDEDARVRAAVAEALGRIRSDSADVLAALIEALGDEDAGVREASFVALGRIVPQAARLASLLIPVLEDEDADLRAAAAEALGRIGVDSADVLSALIQALDDEDDGVRAAAVEALEAITGYYMGDDPDAWRRWWERQQEE